MIHSNKTFWLILLLLLPLSVHAVEQIKLIAIFKNKVIVNIDGKRRLLAQGEESPEGVKLVKSDTITERVTFEIDGDVRELGLSAVMTQPSRDPTLAAVRLWASTDGFFYADGAINGRGVRFLIDTGANTIALSSRHARSIGLDYKKGQRGVATTASGQVPMYRVRLDKVKVGGIELYGIDAGVIEGNFPAEILLGMSFLQRVDMRREGNRLELTKRY